MYIYIYILYTVDVQLVVKTTGKRCHILPSRPSAADRQLYEKLRGDSGTQRNCSCFKLFLANRCQNDHRECTCGKRCTVVGEIPIFRSPEMVSHPANHSSGASWVARLMHSIPVRSSSRWGYEVTDRLHNMGKIWKKYHEKRTCPPKILQP